MLDLRRNKLYRLWVAMERQRINHGASGIAEPQQLSHFVVSFAGGIITRAAEEREARTLFVTGGVAANRELRETFALRSAKAGLPVYFPSRLSTDNAAMIAAAAFPKLGAKDFAETDFSAEASLALR